jgi:hypothetical protein
MGGEDRPLAPPSSHAKGEVKEVHIHLEIAVGLSHELPPKITFWFFKVLVGTISK